MAVHMHMQFEKAFKGAEVTYLEESVRESPDLFGPQVTWST